MRLFVNENAVKLELRTRAKGEGGGQAPTSEAWLPNSNDPYHQYTTLYFFNQ